MVDGRCDLFFGGFDAEELDQVGDDFFGVRGQFGEFDPEDRHVGVRGDERVAMLEQTALQFFALLVGRGEPLAAVFFGSALQRPDRGFDVAIDD